jgi:hypothetical protein
MSKRSGSALEPLDPGSTTDPNRLPAEPPRLFMPTSSGAAIPQPRTETRDTGRDPKEAGFSSQTDGSAVPRGARLPELPPPVWGADGEVDTQATAQTQFRLALPAVAKLIANRQDHATVLAQLQAMPAEAVYATLEQHASRSFMAYALQGGAAPDLGSAATVLEQIRYAQLVAAPAGAIHGVDRQEPSPLRGELMAREREAGLTLLDLSTFFEQGRARGAGNVCMFDTLYLLAERGGHGARLRPFIGEVEGESARVAFGANMQELLARTGLLARTADGGYDQFEFEEGSLATNLLSQIIGMRLVILTRTDSGVRLSPAVGAAGPEAFILRSGPAGSGHFEPLWPSDRLAATSRENPDGLRGGPV